MTQKPITATGRVRATRPDLTALKSRTNSNSQSDWTVEASRQLYGIDRWSNGYFEVNDCGNLTIAPPGLGVTPVEMTEIVDGLRQRGLNMPVMLRIENVLADRIRQLNGAFAAAIEECDYQGKYLGVFPIKVNQQNHVVSEIARLGEEFSHGLEAGSKAELLIAMSCIQSKSSLIICNGYKDEEFVDLGLQATRMGYRCFFVVETPDELTLILERSTYWDVQPLLGVRLKLSTKVDGHWANDSGDRSLFGLSTGQLIDIIDRLRASNQMSCLQLAHVHLGSQIPNIRNIRDGVTEACRFYVELVKEGVPLKYLDLGGGLAVDYDGTASSSASSRNYDLKEYCIDIVDVVRTSLDKQSIPHPTLISESGRWTVAPMSVLIFNILSVTTFHPKPIGDYQIDNLGEATLSLLETLDSLSERRLQENLNDAVYYRDQMRTAFRIGRITLRERAFAENLYLTIVNRIAELVTTQKNPSIELLEMRDSLSDIYYGNFSVFQSLPDAWAIDQVFPVVPLTRLNERPDRNAIIADLTCDCDGKLSRFANNDMLSSTIPLHQLREGDDYLIGVFLVGSYQETLGDLHNLFGDTNVASIRISSEGNIEFEHELEGDAIADVLKYVEFDPQEMFARLRKRAEAAVQEGRITVAQRQQMLNLFGESLRGYTYFES